MNTQTEQEKWQELAHAIGWESLDECGTLRDPVTGNFGRADSSVRDAVLNALTAAKVRTPLELAAQEMASILLGLYRVFPNPYFPWIK